VAPDVQVIAIRQSSKAFSPKDAFAGNQDPATRRKAGDIRTMARAIVHAANMGATVINISEISCMTATDLIDQRDLGAAIHYAAVERNVVIVAAAGNVGDERGVGNDCKQNPIYNPLTPNDPRDWAGVATVVTPAWFSDYVLTVGAVDSSGAPLDSSVAGPWVSIAAPGTDIESLSPRDDGLMNAVEGNKNTLVPQAGTSFSAALVSGVAALVRAKYPQLTAHQVINRLLATARAPARGVDNQVGHGIVDPVAALTYDLPPGEPVGPQRLAAPLVLAPPKVGRDMTPVWVAGAGVGGLALLCSVVLGCAALMRRRGARP
jgi:membrane-anchored mycosin MYCP